MQEFLTIEELNIFILLFDMMLLAKNHLSTQKFKLLGETLEIVFYYFLISLLSEILLGLKLEYTHAILCYCMLI